MHRWRSLIGLVVMLLPGVACGPVQTPSALTLAATLPLSGRDATARAWSRGYERAVTEANAAGGVLLRATGRRVRVLLQVRDDGGDISRAERAAEELLASGVHAMLATPGAVRMAVQAAVAGRFSRPYVVPAPAGPELKATDRPWVLVAPDGGGSDEEMAYQTARAALGVFEVAPTLDTESIRRTFAAIAKTSTSTSR